MTELRDVQGDFFFDPREEENESDFNYIQDLCNKFNNFASKYEVNERALLMNETIGDAGRYNIEIYLFIEGEESLLLVGSILYNPFFHVYFTLYDKELQTLWAKRIGGRLCEVLRALDKLCIFPYKTPKGSSEVKKSKNERLKELFEEVYLQLTSVYMDLLPAIAQTNKRI